MKQIKDVKNSKESENLYGSNIIYRKKIEKISQSKEKERLIEAK